MRLRTFHIANNVVLIVIYCKFAAEYRHETVDSSLDCGASANLHHPPIFFTGRMPFLPPNQQCQSTEGN